MAKLTLSVDEAVVERAKRYAARRGTSVSKLVQRYLSLLSAIGSTRQGDESTPVLRRLRGALKGADATGHRRHLERKYR